MAVYTVDGNVMARCSTTKRVYRIDKIDDLKSHGFFQNSSKHSPGCRQRSMNFCTLFLCAVRSVPVLLHLCTCFLRIVLGPSFFKQFVQRVVGIFMFPFFIDGG